MNKYVFSALTLVLVLFASGFAGGYNDALGIDPDLKVALGAAFAVTMEANPTTGYSWSVDHISPDGSIKVLESSYSSVQPALMGSGGYQTWLLKGLIKGKAKILFIYKRPWEKDITPAETRTYQITVY